MKTEPKSGAGSLGGGILLAIAALPLLAFGGILLILVSVRQAYGGKGADERKH